MSEDDGLDGLDLTQRIVLIGVVDLSRRAETPAHAGEVRRTCVEALDAVEADVVGTVTEAEAARTLNELEAETLLDGTRDDTSATGKGRPRFDLAVDVDDILAELGEDDRLRPVVSRIQSS